MSAPGNGPITELAAGDLGAPASIPGNDGRPPRVLVLLASYNGAQWIGEQIESILKQVRVDVRLIIRDDRSTDSTLEEIARFEKDDRITLCHPARRTGSAGQNFFTLIDSTPADDFEFVAFSDQDDVWYEEKLARACQMLRGARCAGYSSATLAVWADGRTAALEQYHVQTKGDFLFEGAGQGCTFVVHTELYDRIRRFFQAHRDLLAQIHYHDWTTYALARAWGYTWTLDRSPSAAYRQHSTNDTGARRSISGVRKRVKLVRNGWYKSQLVAISRLCAAAAPANRTVGAWHALLHGRDGWHRRLQIARFCLSNGRRRALDRMIVTAAALLGWI